MTVHMFCKKLRFETLAMQGRSTQDAMVNVLWGRSLSESSLTPKPIIIMMLICAHADCLKSQKYLRIQMDIYQNNCLVPWLLASLPRSAK